MGVPGFFRNLIKEYRNTHDVRLHKIIEYLFLDYNNLIYLANISVEKSKKWNFPTENQQYEDDLIKMVLKITKELVEIVDPQKLVYIAIDGPPPFAKMKQQRERRNFGVWNKKFLLDTYGFTEEKWDTYNISPGTLFMDKLDKIFKKELSGKYLAKYNVVYDGPKRPKEAEHKFLPLFECMNIKKDEPIVILSPDADQIILSLKFTDLSIYIMRGLTTDQRLQLIYPGEKWLYLDIDLVRQEMVKKFQILPQLSSITSFIQDITLIGFLGGNDFIPAIYYLKVKDDRYNTAISAYKKSNYPNLVISPQNKHEHYQINTNNLQKIFYAIAQNEWELIQQKNKRVNQVYQGFNNGDERTLDQCENNGMENIEHLFIYCPNHPLYKHFWNKWEQLYQNWKPEFWKHSYYQLFFELDYTRTNIEQVCYEYSKALLFNLRYYFGDTLSWRYSYPYKQAPLPSDYALFLFHNPDVFEKINLVPSEPLHPFVQLAYILPAHAQKILLPDVYTDLYLTNSDMSNAYTDNYNIDYLSGDKLIYISLDLPYPDIQKLDMLHKLVESKFNTKDKERDRLEKTPKIFWEGR